MHNDLEELGNIRFKDERLSKRFRKSVKKLVDNPGESILGAFKDIHQAKGFYRLLANPRASIQEIQSCLKHSTYERIHLRNKINELLVVQDTTDLNYSSHPSKKELGEIQNRIERGLRLHPSLVFTRARIPLGIIGGKVWTRDPAVMAKEKKKSVKQKDIERNKKKIEEKESYRWLESLSSSLELARAFPEKQIINLSDSESDIYDLYVKAQESQVENLKYIIRSRHNRFTVGGKNIKEELEEQRVAGRVRFSLKRGTKIRDVEQEISYKEVELVPPSGKRELAGVKVTVVLAKETKESAGENKPIEWLVLTNKRVKGGKQAIEILDCYLARWDIEVYFKILKSGCKIERVQLEGKENVIKCVLMYMLVAWRIMYTMKLGRQEEEVCEKEVFSELELKCLYGNAKKSRKKGGAPLKEAIYLLAKLGGYPGRKSDGPPGPKPMWLGMQRLHYMVLGGQLLTQ